LLNLVVFVSAYPETRVTDSGCCGNRPLARDFSAFYIAAWRLFNDPSQVYKSGFLPDGESQVLPQPESYKYLPSFLLLVSPFLILPYQSALTAFDVFQFLLLPLIGLLVYELTRERGLPSAILLSFLVLLLPLPAPGLSASAPYYWQWAEGQSKVLETLLLLLSFYLGKTRRPHLSGIVLGVAAFDPRFVLVSIPLFVTYNRASLSSAFLSATGSFLVSNAALLIPGVGTGFIAMLLGNGLTTPLYFYSLIPLFTVVALTLTNLGQVVEAFKAHISSDSRTIAP